VRAVLYLVAATLAVGLVGVGVSILGASVVVAGVSLLLTGEANAVGFALLAGLGVLTTGGLAAGVVVAARRLDRRLTDADRRPDPLATVQARYVAGEIDERTLERRVERLLAGGDETRPHRLRWLWGALGSLLSLARSRASDARHRRPAARSRARRQWDWDRYQYQYQFRNRDRSLERDTEPTSEPR
jgi:hypothetical protein